jgi:hypothetical protein
MKHQVLFSTQLTHFYRWKALLSNAFCLPKRSFASLYSLVVIEKVPNLLKAPNW